MNKLYTLMDDFHAAILNGTPTSFAEQVSPNPRITPEAQMNIYVEGYRLRLHEAIAADYPATLTLLGDTVFNALALAFIEATPPQHFSLDHYPYAFASYVRDHANNPFAADLAGLESTIAEVFLIEESEALTATALANLTPEDFAETTLRPRSASRLLETTYPVDEAISQNRKGETMQKPDAATSYLYVLRHDNEVKRHTLSKAEYLVLQQLAANVPVGPALESVAEAHPELLPEIAANIQSWFTHWTAHGFFQSPKE